MYFSKLYFFESFFESENTAFGLLRSAERCITAAGGLLRGRCMYIVQLRSRRSSCSLYNLPSRSRVGPRSEEEEEGVVEAAGLAGKQPAGSCAQLRRRRQAKQHPASASCPPRQLSAQLLWRGCQRLLRDRV